MQFIDRLNAYMTSINFQNMNSIYMWELQMVAYIKFSKIYMINGKIHTAQKACGIGNLVGNKGGIQMYFNLNDKTYNFMGCHLRHG